MDISIERHHKKFLPWKQLAAGVKNIKLAIDIVILEYKTISYHQSRDFC